nr:NADH dehydrogenase subunit 4L [Nigrobaetis niger]
MMKLYIILVIAISVTAGLWSFTSLRTHLIATLLSLEFASLSTYLFLFMLLVQTTSDIYVSLVYLTLAACEGALGLSVLVVMIKNKGNDYLKSSNLVQC